MHDLAHFRKSQKELLSLIKDLQSLMTDNMVEMSRNSMTAFQLMCELGIRIQEHLGEADRFVYPYLLLHEDPRVQSIAWGFINRENPLRHSYVGYYMKWLKNFDFAFNQDLIRDSQEIFELVAERIERENRELFPWLEELGLIPKRRG